MMFNAPPPPTPPQKNKTKKQQKKTNNCFSNVDLLIKTYVKSYNYLNSYRTFLACSINTFDLPLPHWNAAPQLWGIAYHLGTTHRHKTDPSLYF